MGRKGWRNDKPRGTQRMDTAGPARSPRRGIGSGTSDDGGLDLRLFVILAGHLIQDDGVPGQLAPRPGDVVFTSPPPQAEFFDEIEFRRYTV